MGVHVARCNCPIVEDLYKIFEIYWEIAADNAKIPDKWHKKHCTYYNLTIPLKIELEGNETANVSLSVSVAVF